MKTFSSFSSGGDVQNLIKFLYTGKASLTEKEFDVFQQMVYEFQIRTEEETAIILEQINRTDVLESEKEVAIFLTFLVLTGADFTLLFPDLREECRSNSHQQHYHLRAISKHGRFID